MLKLHDKNFSIWGSTYDVYKDRYGGYYFLKDGKWITPAHQRYYEKYRFGLNALFNLTYGSVMRKLVPQRNNLFSQIPKDDIWKSGRYFEKA
jgi:hypothetical protein